MRKITELQLQKAIERAALGPEVYERIRAELDMEPQVAASFEAAHIAYYLGALLIIGAMGWFITSAWDRLAGTTLTAIAVGYAIAFGWAGWALWQKAETKIPGGVLVAVAVCMTPLAVYGIERQLGWWPSDNPGGYSRFHPYIDGGWVLMELATVLCAFFALRFVRFAFIAAPAAYAMWYLSMDATAYLFGKTWTFHQEAEISVAFGLVMLVLGYLFDGETDIDLAFWFYLFGLLTFTGGLSLMGGGTQIGKAIYCLLHVVLIVLSIVLQRRAFLVFGALGVFIYIADEAQTFFRNSISFTFALTALGVLFIFAGIGYKRNEAELTRVLHPWIPDRIRHRHALEVA